MRYDVSEFDPIAATATAEAAPSSPAVEVEGQGATQSQSPAAGSEISGGPGPVPYDRFTAINTRMQQAESQAQQYAPFAPLIEAARQAGITPEQMAQRVFAQQQQQAVAQADPDAPLREFLAARGLDAEYLTQDMVAAYRQDMLRNQQFDRWMADQQQQQVIGGFERSLNQVDAAHPMFKDHQDLKEFLVAATWANDQTGAQMPQLAARFDAAIERVVQARMASYVAAKTADAAFPVTAGGGAPAPTDVPNLHTMDQVEKTKFLRGWMANQGREG